METKRTIDEILVELSYALDNPIRETIDKKLENEVFNDLKNVSGLQEYLLQTLGSDMKRYFSASTDIERSQVRGAFSRTAYLSGKITAAEKMEVYKEDTKNKRKDLQRY